MSNHTIIKLNLQLFPFNGVKNIFSNITLSTKSRKHTFLSVSSNLSVFSMFSSVMVHPLSLLFDFFSFSSAQLEAQDIKFRSASHLTYPTQNSAVCASGNLFMMLTVASTQCRDSMECIASLLKALLTKREHSYANQEC